MSIIIGGRQLRTHNVKRNMLAMFTEGGIQRLKPGIDPDRALGGRDVAHILSQHLVMYPSGMVNIQKLDTMSRDPQDRGWRGFLQELKGAGFQVRTFLEDAAGTKSAIIGKLGLPEDVLEPKWGKDQALVEMAVSGALRGDRFDMNVAMTTIAPDNIKVFLVDLTGMGGHDGLGVKHIVDLVHAVAPGPQGDPAYDGFISKACSSEMILAITANQIYFIPFSRKSEFLKEAVAAQILTEMRPEFAETILDKMGSPFSDKVRTMIRRK